MFCVLYTKPNIVDRQLVWLPDVILCVVKNQTNAWFLTTHETPTCYRQPHFLAKVLFLRSNLSKPFYVWLHSGRNVSLCMHSILKKLSNLKWKWVSHSRGSTSHFAHLFCLCSEILSRCLYNAAAQNALVSLEGPRHKQFDIRFTLGHCHNIEQQRQNYQSENRKLTPSLHSQGIFTPALYLTFWILQLHKIYWPVGKLEMTAVWHSFYFFRILHIKGRPGKKNFCTSESKFCLENSSEHKQNKWAKRIVLLQLCDTHFHIWEVSTMQYHGQNGQHCLIYSYSSQVHSWGCSGLPQAGVMGVAAPWGRGGGVRRGWSPRCQIFLACEYSKLARYWNFMYFKHVMLAGAVHLQLCLQLQKLHLQLKALSTAAKVKLQPCLWLPLQLWRQHKACEMWWWSVWWIYWHRNMCQSKNPYVFKRTAPYVRVSSCLQLVSVSRSWWALSTAGFCPFCGHLHGQRIWLAGIAEAPNFACQCDWVKEEAGEQEETKRDGDEL